MEQAYSKAGASVILVMSCFVALSWLNGRYAASGAGDVTLYVVLGLALSVLCLAGLAGLVLASNAPMCQAGGFPAALGAVTRGFLTVLPFTLLALLAELVFKWQAAPAFIQAAVMTSGAAVGAEVIRYSGPRLKYMIVPMAGAFAFSMAWTGFSYLFSKVAG